MFVTQFQIIRIILHYYYIFINVIFLIEVQVTHYFYKKKCFKIPTLIIYSIFPLDILYKSVFSKLICTSIYQFQVYPNNLGLVFVLWLVYLHHSPFFLFNLYFFGSLFFNFLSLLFLHYFTVTSRRRVDVCILLFDIVQFICGFHFISTCNLLLNLNFSSLLWAHFSMNNIKNWLNNLDFFMV